METCDPTGLEAEALRSTIEGLELNQSSFAGLLSELGDKRELKTILRSIQRMASADARVSGEMQVILTLLQRDKWRARRIAQATQWTERDNGGLTAEIQGVRLTLHPQSRGRWSIHARHMAEGPDGYSPSIPHWRSSLEAAKIRAVLAVDETLDHIERIKAELGEVA
ncbi:hypothetical protein IP65_20585 [Novosphingobium sp. AAP1]|uniref:hypothetical protein n=1 Tax=Novosphingobium sp. AAP1 TaxID=1523413 RepID=UPI0006B9A76F|nr:hypothetical protein [Novosphingobium sp. AAP1]KPF48873.1 hypothetical protein IP65_20585 [Novosphingobium sp. AAP1]